MLRDEQGYSLAFWASFLSFLLIPMLWLGIGIGRYAIAAAEVQQAADLAALAAVRDVDVRVFESSGRIQFAGSVYGRAWAYANANTSYLAREGILVQVDAIAADSSTRTVYVRCSANVSPLFPPLFQNLRITRTGIAEIRMRSQ